MAFALFSHNYYYTFTFYLHFLLTLLLLEPQKIFKGVIHGNLFSYRNFQFTRKRTKVTIIRTNGGSWRQRVLLSLRPRDRVLRFQSRRPGAIRREHPMQTTKDARSPLMHWNSNQESLDEQDPPSLPSTLVHVLALPTGCRKSFSAPVATDKLRRFVRSETANKENWKNYDFKETKNYVFNKGNKELLEEL